MYHTNLHELVHLTFFVLTLNHLVKNIYTGEIASLYNVTFLNPQTSVCSPIPSLKNDHCCYHCIIILISFSSYSSSTFLLFPLPLSTPFIYRILPLFLFVRSLILSSSFTLCLSFSLVFYHSFIPSCFYILSFSLSSFRLYLSPCDGTTSGAHYHVQ